MEVGQKEAIICVKMDKNGRKVTIPIYIIDDAMCDEFKSLIRKKEEYQNSYLIKTVLPKNLFEQLEKADDITDYYISEKKLQFQIHGNDLEPYSLKMHMDNLKII